MKRIILLTLTIVALLSVHAQTARQTTLPIAQPTAEDPVIMTINGQQILRSEFEYSYNKNNTEGVIDKKTIDEYLPLFVNYKLKVAAALDEKMDTATAFINEFITYRDQQIRPSFINDSDVEAKAKEIYDKTKQQISEMGGLFNFAHIFFPTSQKLSSDELQQIRTRADSISEVIKKGKATFEEMEQLFSQDNVAHLKNGELGWAPKGSFFPEFEEAAHALKDGEISGVVTSPAGLHIIKRIGQREFFEYDSVKNDIMQFINARNIRETIINDKLKAMAETADNGTTPESIIDQQAYDMQQKDPALRNLIREYHDGLLLFDISNREVWEKANNDENALKQFFLKNRKNYTWNEPRYKGMIYHVKDKATEKAVKKCVKKLDFELWKETLRSSFNNDSVIRIRVELGRFKPGDNKWIDQKVFNKTVKPEKNKDYPIENIFGKLLKAPENYHDVRTQLVADYQEFLEKQWVEQLRKRYQVVVNNDVLATVNNH